MVCIYKGQQYYSVEALVVDSHLETSDGHLAAILILIVSPTRSGDTMDSSSLSSASAEISC